MASGGTYPDPDTAMAGASGLYPGGASPAQQQQQQQQQQQHLSAEADLQMQENLAQLQRSSEMMHAGPPQPQQMNPLAAHHHFQSPPRPTHSPQQLAQTAVMNMEDHGIYADHDAASRKRSKVSRACDECRRKKIRCDATSENGPEACSSCKRTGARCQFSRQPMKRGPSKGYIKELADRLNSLENQIQNPHSTPHPPPPPTYDYTGLSDHSLNDPHLPSHLSRKRTHSISEGLQDPYIRQSWSSQDRGDFHANGQSVRRSSFSDMTLAGNLITGSNEGAIKAYYACIHPILPILSHEASSLNRLTNCPAKLRELFFHSLECAVRTLSPAALPQEVALPQLVQQCLESLPTVATIIQDADWSRTFYNDLVFCQSLLFLVIAADKPVLGSTVTASELLGRLAGRVSALGLNDAKTMMSFRDQDRETFDEGRRLYWGFFILDRFLASSRDRDATTPTHAALSRDDFVALGDVGYHLARAADIAGQISHMIRAGNVLNLDPTSPFAFIQLTNSSPEQVFLNGQIARFKESIEITDLADASPPYLAYRYLRILATRQSLQTPSKLLLSLAKELLHSLIMTQITPLHHMFGQVVAQTFADLSDRVETQVEAHAAIKEMDDAIATGNIAHRVPNGSGWDSVLRNLLHQKKALTPPLPTVERASSAGTQPNMAGLQHLAAAAVGEREGAEPARPNSSGGGNGTIASQPNQEMKHDVTAAMAAASEAAAAQATAAAVQKQLQGGSDAPHGNGGNASNGQVSGYESGALAKDGFDVS